MALRFACEECDYVTDDRELAEDHVMETAHFFREVEHTPVVDTSDEG